MSINTENSTNYWIVNFQDGHDPRDATPDPPGGIPIEFEELDGYWKLLLDTPHLKIRRHESFGHRVTQLWVRT